MFLIINVRTVLKFVLGIKVNERLKIKRTDLKINDHVKIGKQRRYDIISSKSHQKLKCIGEKKTQNNFDSTPSNQVKKTKGICPPQRPMSRHSDQLIFFCSNLSKPFFNVHGSSYRYRYKIISNHFDGVRIAIRYFFQLFPEPISTGTESRTFPSFQPGALPRLQTVFLKATYQQKKGTG